MTPRPKARWVGIDEAGYGPNLGPLVMVSVVAESVDDRPPDLWRDLESKVARAGTRTEGRLWVDDSKAVYQAGRGREWLEAGCLAIFQALDRGEPTTLEGVFEACGAGSLSAAELSPWRLQETSGPRFPRPETIPLWERLRPSKPLETLDWRIVGLEAVVVGPSAFNAGLERPNANKASVHFDAFRTLLGNIWSRCGDGVVIRLTGDKHGGRHFYYEPLLNAFPGAWIDRGVESPALSRYVVRGPHQRLEIAFKPKADADNGLVALASIVAKTIRELWMDVFNDYWVAQCPGLKRSAGYPVDAGRFRLAIQARADELGHPLSTWWRAR